MSRRRARRPGDITTSDTADQHRPRGPASSFHGHANAIVAHTPAQDG